MARQAAGDNEQCVYANVVPGSGEARDELLGRRGDSPQSVAVERQVGALPGRALLDLDEGQRSPTARDQVDLTAVNANAPADDSPAVQAEPPGGERLGAPAAAFGLRSIQLSAPSSSARA